MDRKVYAIQIAHIRRCLSSLRLLNLEELQASAQRHGGQADRDLIAALMLALETLPDDGH